MSRFAIDVTREGGWWMGHIPELGGLTQARYPGEGRANGTRVHRGQYRNAHRPGGYQLASLPAVTPGWRTRAGESDTSFCSWRLAGMASTRWIDSACS